LLIFFLSFGLVKEGATSPLETGCALEQDSRTSKVNTQVEPISGTATRQPSLLYLKCRKGRVVRQICVRSDPPRNHREVIKQCTFRKNFSVINALKQRKTFDILMLRYVFLFLFIFIFIFLL